MKKILFSTAMIFLAVYVQAQNGLENILVERYYISDATDTSANPDGGILPPGSVTYRIFVDMLPGYKFQAAFGSPTHELRIQTSTLFFNNEDRGAITPSYSISQAANHTVMLDSWLSVGAACAGHFGIPKANDNGMVNVINSYVPQVLQSANPLAGIPLTIQDGIIAGTNSPPLMQLIGTTINSDVAVFDDQNDGTNGPVFSLTNGSWYSFSGVTGPDSASNQVLIAQITTNGVFSFQLNIQLGKPNGAGTEKYVASNPTGVEIEFPGLNYNSTVTGVTQVPTGASMPSWNVYPNPSGNIVTLEIHTSKESNNNKYVVYDELGSIVMERRLGQFGDAYLESVDISSLASGLYFFQLTTGDMTTAKKIIKY